MRDEKDNREETEYKRQAGTSTTPSRRRKKKECANYLLLFY